jgi:hypothetical protein
VKIRGQVLLDFGSSFVVRSIRAKPALESHPSPKHWLLLIGMAAGAILVHGYHPFVEDGEIYVPGIRKALNPALYPHNDGFFASHAHLTLFPHLIAASVRLTHLPLEWALLLWQFGCIFMLLLGCWHVGRLVFRDPLAKWGGVALVASLLTIPVAGTALYIMDQYVTTRATSTPAVIFIVVDALEKRWWRAGAWAIFAALIHPLMAVFGIAYALLLLWMGRSPQRFRPGLAALALPFGLFPPVTGPYRDALESRSYFFLMRWEWYEWLGLVAPLFLLWWFGRIARKQHLPRLMLTCRALVVYGVIFFAASLAVSVPAGMARFAELQPMRFLHLLYILMFVIGGGLLAQFVLKGHAWRWALLFVPLCLGMHIAQHELFPATAHIEWPGVASKNPWVQAFEWIRGNTPPDAYFALNPDHMALPGEDQHGFRAMAERSMLADRLKDSGAVSMFPALAEAWQRQLHAQEGWQSFQPQDFRRLKQQFGVDWVVLEHPVGGMQCPYRNAAVLVCSVD